MEVLEFIFQDFWHWAGTVVLVSLICGAVCGGLIRIGR